MQALQKMVVYLLMKTLDLQRDGIEICAAEAAAVLRRGGMVLYPTDTIYGLGVDAMADLPIQKVYACKGRDEDKPVHAIVADIAEAERYGQLTPAARKLARAFWPGKLTLVVNYVGRVDGGIARRASAIGLRIPQHAFCLELARRFGKPYTTTSANRAGAEPQCTVEGIFEQLDDAAHYIDLVIDGGAIEKCEPSTVVDATGASPVILREGAIPAADIWDALRD